MRHLARRKRGGDVPARIARLALVVTALVAGFPRESFARLGGMEQAGGCASCHGIGVTAPTVTIVPDSANVAAGQKVTLTISIKSPAIVVGGFYLPKPSTGAFTALPGTKLWPDGGITHAAPARATASEVTFKVEWTAPTTPTIGGVNLQLYALAANGDNTNKNDSPSDAFLSFAYGCGAGTKFYFDGDGDGYGTLDFGYTVTCAQPANYATQAGDCRDNDPKVNPGAMEICDGKDNNCSGSIDEGLANSMLCEDKDGDGHGVMGGMTHIGCAPDLKGFGLCDGDCKDDDPTVYPGAEEQCNERDDNCDGKIDENARPTCGQGWCKRYGEGCGANLCIPGKPLPETCNLFDDDCDGVIDNGADMALCGENGGCRGGRCVPIGDGGSGATTTTGSGPATGSDTTAGTTTGSTGSGSTVSGAGGGGPPRPSNAGQDVGCAFHARGRSGAWGLWVALVAAGFARRASRMARARRHVA